MIGILKLITIGLLILIVAFHLFNQISSAIIVGIYPYMLALALIFSLLFLVGRFIDEKIFLRVINYAFIALSIFAVFTLFQVWRNAKLLNGYQQNRSSYMDQLHKITATEGKPLLDTTFQKGIATLIEGNTGMPVTAGNDIALMSNGVTLIDEMIEEISRAKHHIHIEFFIIRDDEIGRKFSDTLIKKAKEGVAIRLIYDGLGSRELNKSVLKELREGGVKVGIYDDVMQSILKGKLNHRNHRKILLIDGEIAYIGGFNIGNEYLGRDKSIGPWNDLQMKVRGELVLWIQKIFLGDWCYVTEERLIDEDFFPSVKGEADIAAQMITSGYDTHWNEISQLYFSLISGAREKVYIATPYLILNEGMVKALQTAALRGVEVRIVLPEKPDVFIVGWANSSFYADLIKAGVKIYLFKEGFLHSKAFCADGEITSVGSANFNSRSMFLDYEVNAVVYDYSITEEMEEIFDTYFKKSHLLNSTNYRKNPAYYNRLKHIIARIVLPFT